MKLLKSLTGEVISFRVDGSTLLEITPEGIEARDEHAKVVEKRIGGAVVSVEPARSEKPSKAEAKPDAEAEAETKEEAKDSNKKSTK